MNRLALSVGHSGMAIAITFGAFVFAGSAWAQGAAPAPPYNPGGGNWAPVGSSSPGGGQLGAPQPLPPAQTGEEAAPLSPQQLDNLVAPIALYPDELLSQILAASTYPLEIVDAEQWLQQNKNLAAQQLVDAAKQQNWDPSVQALVALPDVLDILGRDIHWTTDLGNAFLSQQSDVMAAIQQMRAKAEQNGQLKSGPQQTVTTQYQDGQGAIQIAPTDPQTVYVPEYQPAQVYGPPAYGAYPSLWYPPAWGAYGGYGAYPACGAYPPYGPYGAYGYDGGYGCPGIGYSSGIFLGGLFRGLLGFGSWGWGLNWFGHSAFLVPNFFSHYYGGWWGIHGGAYLHGPLYAGRPLWSHDPVHRLGVPYGNRAVAARYGGTFGGRVGGSAVAASRGLSAARTAAPRNQALRNGAARNEASRSFNGANRAPSGNQFAARNNAGRTGESYSGRGGYSQSFRSGGGSTGGYSMNRSAQGARPQARQAAPRQEAPRQAAPRQNMSRSFSAPSSRGSGSAQHFSAPRSSAPSRGSSSHGSSPRASGGGGGHSGGGHSGRR